MIPYADVESDVLDRFSSSNALRNRSQIVRDPHGSYRSGESAPDRPMGAKTARGLKTWTIFSAWIFALLHVDLEDPEVARTHWVITVFL